MAEEKVKKTHWLKPARGDWTVEHEDRTVAEVKDFINGIRVKEIEDAGAAYVDAYAVVHDIQWALAQEAQALARVWDGKASVAAQKALRTLYMALGEFAEKLLEMGHPLVTLADVVRQHQEYLDGHLRGAMNGDARLAPWSDDGHWLGAYAVFNGAMPRYEDAVVQGGGYSLAGTLGTSRDELAGLHLKTFNEDLKAIYDRMPGKVEKELPAITYPVKPTVERTSLDPRFGRPSFDGPSVRSGADPVHARPTGLSGGSADALGDRATAAEHPTLTDVPHLESPDVPARPDDRGEPDLDRGPDVPSPGAAPGARDPYGHAPSPGDPIRSLDQPTRVFGQPTGPHTELATFQRPADPHSTPLHPTPASPTHSLPTGPNHSPVTAFGVPGTGPSIGSGSINGGATASHGMGAPFMPMSGASGMGGQEEKDRESGTWLHEDDDVWGGDVDGVVDSRLG